MGSVLIVEMNASEPATSPPPHHHLTATSPPPHRHPTPHGRSLLLQTNHKDFNFDILENLKLMKLVY